MSIASPSFAAVRPRVIEHGSGESRLLDEVMSEVAEEFPAGIIRITGGPGSGKSTALAHLAAVFAHDDRFVFLDEPKPEEIDACADGSLVVATMPRSGGRGKELALQPWGRDELIEYLLAKHHDACGSVIQRFGAAVHWSWAPELACIVLDRFIVDESLHEPTTALLQQVYEGMPDLKQQAAANWYCLAMLRRREPEFETATARFSNSDCPPSVRRLLRHKLIQLPLASDRLISTIKNGDFSDLEQQLPSELVELTGARCRDDKLALDRLRNRLSTQRGEAAHPMAASILVAADPAWQPPKRRDWSLSGAIFSRALWSGIDLTRAKLTFCNFRDADLKAAVLDKASLDSAQFGGADLRKASLIAASGTNASFCQVNLASTDLTGAQLGRSDFTEADLAAAILINSNLTGADLSSAQLRRADLSRARLVDATVQGADFTEAVLRQTNFTGVDLRTACLDGACLEEAVLIEAQMEDIRIVGAQLRNALLNGAHLTGSSLPAADLRGAKLCGAGLAEIDWEEADLRGADLTGATFHMGSSRSGIVGSPIACEGSKTGFYTDDLEDMSFKPPEEIRKANLRGANLLEVNARGVDFYLVDLRDAKMHPKLREQARQSGAILEDSAP